MADYSGKTWSSLSDLVAETGLENKLDPKWPSNESTTIAVASFYEQWAQYLRPVTSIFVFFIIIPEYISKWLYSLSYALEVVFENLFKLMGIIDTVSDSSSMIGQVYAWAGRIGLGLFIVLVMFRITLAFLGAPFKYKELFSNLILVTAAISVLPTFLTTMTGLIADSSSNLTNYNFGNSVKGSLSIQPLQQNVTDLKLIIRNNFNLESMEATMDDSGFLVTTNNLNRITDKNIWSTNFTRTIGPDNKELMEAYKEKGDNSSTYSGVATILSSVLDDVNYSDGEANITMYKSRAAGTPFAMMNMTRLRFKVNWIALFAQQIVLLLLLFGLAMRMVQTVFRVSVATMVAPIVGWTTIDDSSKFVELLQEVVSGIAGIWFEVLMVKFAIWFLTNYKTVSLTSASTISGNFFSGLGYFETIVGTLAVYIGTFLAVAQGSSAIERWLGINTGVGKDAAMGAMATVGAYRGAKGIGQSIVGKPGPNGKRYGGVVGNARSIANFGGKVQNGVNHSIKGLGNKIKNTGREFQNISKGVSTFAGAVSNPKGTFESMGDSVKGSVEQFKSNVSSSLRNVSTRGKEEVSKFIDPFKEGYDNGRDFSKGNSFSRGKTQSSNRDLERDFNGIGELNAKEEFNFNPNERQPFAPRVNNELFASLNSSTSSYIDNHNSDLTSNKQMLDKSQQTTRLDDKRFNEFKTDSFEL